MAYYDTVIAADAPAAWWPVTDANGAGTIADASGGGHAATNSGITLGQANAPVAGETTGLLTATSKATSAYVPNGLTAATVEAWTYITSSVASQYALAAGIGASNQGIGIFFTNLTANTRFGNGTTTVAPPYANAVVLNTWQYWAFTWDGAHIQGYLDGAAIGVLNAFTGPVPASGSTFLGGAFSNSIAGDLAQVAIYNYALSPAQVANHFAAASGAPSGTAVASGCEGSPAYHLRGYAQQHFAHRARVQGTLGRGNR